MTVYKTHYPIIYSHSQTNSSLIRQPLATSIIRKTKYSKTKGKCNYEQKDFLSTKLSLFWSCILLWGHMQIKADHQENNGDPLESITLQHLVLNPKTSIFYFCRHKNLCMKWPGIPYYQLHAQIHMELLLHQHHQHKLWRYF